MSTMSRFKTRPSYPGRFSRYHFPLAVGVNRAALVHPGGSNTASIKGLEQQTELKMANIKNKIDV